MSEPHTPTPDIEIGHISRSPIYCPIHSVNGMTREGIRVAPRNSDGTPNAYAGTHCAVCLVVRAKEFKQRQDEIACALGLTRDDSMSGYRSTYTPGDIVPRITALQAELVVALREQAAADVTLEIAFGYMAECVDAAVRAKARLGESDA